MYYIRTFTPEMIIDLYKMSLVDFSKKWEIDKGTASRYCKAHNIPIFWDITEGAKVFTPEMIDDLGKMGNVDFKKKWGISFTTIGKNRKKYGKKFNNVGGRIDHRVIDGIEYKWCGKKHWEPISNFIKSSWSWDGLNSVCRTHLHIAKKESGIRCDVKRKQREARKDPANRERFMSYDRKSRAIRKHALVSWKQCDERTAYDLFNHRCAYCGKEVDFLNLEFDHFVPIKLGGLTEPKNMVISCHACNRNKNAFEPLEWLTKKFGEDRAILIYRDIKKKLKLVRKIEDQHLMSIEREEERGNG